MAHVLSGEDGFMTYIERQLLKDNYIDLVYIWRNLLTVKIKNFNGKKPTEGKTLHGGNGDQWSGATVLFPPVVAVTPCDALFATFL